MKYIQMVLTNIKEQVMQKSIYNVEILMNPLEVFQIGTSFLVVVEIVERKQYLNKKLKKNY